MIDSDDEDRLDSTSSDDGSSSDDSIFDSSDSSDEDLLIDALLAHEAATKQRRVEYPRAHRIREPWVTFNPAEFERLTEFAPRYVLDMCTQMERMPRVVVTPSRCKASLELAMTIVLLRFTGEDTTRPWSQIASILRSCETYLIAIFQQTGFLLALHYETLATCLDVLYLQPRLRQFAEAVRDTGAIVWPTVLTLDGKTWRSCRPHRSFNDYDNDIDFQMAVYDGQSSRLPWALLARRSIPKWNLCDRNWQCFWTRPATLDKHEHHRCLGVPLRRWQSRSPCVRLWRPSILWLPL